MTNSALISKIDPVGTINQQIMYSVKEKNVRGGVFKRVIGNCPSDNMILVRNTERLYTSKISSQTSTVELIL